MAPPRCGCCWPTTAATRTTRTAWPHIAPLLLQHTDIVSAPNVAETSRTQSHSTTPDSGLLRSGLFTFVVTVVNKSGDITAHVSGHMSFFLHTNNSPAVRWNWGFRRIWQQTALPQTCEVVELEKYRRRPKVGSCKHRKNTGVPRYRMWGPNITQHYAYYIFNIFS